MNDTPPVYILICPGCHNRLSNAKRLPARRTCSNRSCGTTWMITGHTDGEPIYTIHSK